MNPVAAGGVDPYLVRKLSLLADIAPDAEAQATHLNDAARELIRETVTALTAAQAQADRLREVLILTRKMIAGYMDAEYLAMDETATVGLGQYLDTAIHAAKTEQERGE